MRNLTKKVLKKLNLWCVTIELLMKNIEGVLRHMHRQGLLEKDSKNTGN